MDSGGIGQHLRLKRLMAYRQGALTAAEQEAVQEHLALCPLCTGLLLELRDFEEAVASSDTGPESQRQVAWDALVRRLDGEQTASAQSLQQFDAAVEVVHKAGEVSRERGQTHLLASTLVQKAIGYLDAGEPDRAVRILNRAIPLIDQEEVPHLLLAACHNLVRCYIDLDQPAQALRLHVEIRGLYQEFQDDDQTLARSDWQEGQLQRKNGLLRVAVLNFLRARKGFMECSLFYEAALVSLDLSEVFVQLGDVQGARQAVAEMLPIFRSLPVDRRTLAALRRLQAALRRLQEVANEDLQLELIRQLTSRLKHLSRRSPQ